jgi:hypothetical protein
MMRAMLAVALASGVACGTAMAGDAALAATTTGADARPMAAAAMRLAAQSDQTSIACQMRCQLDAGPCNRESSDDPAERSRQCGEEQRRCEESCQP